MDAFWYEIHRYLVDSVRELDRLIEQMRRLVEKCPRESIDQVSSGLKNEKVEPGRIDETGQVYMTSVSARPGTNPNGNCATLAKEGEFWTIAWDRRSLCIKDSKGVRLLRILVESPGRQFHVLDLEGYERKPDPTRGDSSFALSDGCPILDEGAKNAYKARLVELRDELEEAQGFNDIFRTSKIKEEMAILTSELARAFGLHGRSRRALSDAERARVRVTLAVKAAIDKIAKYDSSIGWHFASSVKTGAFCLYRPAPIAGHSYHVQRTPSEA
jgi:hypothetical protein